VPKRVAECRRLASEARRMADAASTPAEKADLLQVERRWLSLQVARIHQLLAFGG
jgi:hypothetical protein